MHMHMRMHVKLRALPVAPRNNRTVGNHAPIQVGCDHDIEALRVAHELQGLYAVTPCQEWYTPIAHTRMHTLFMQ